MVTKTGSTHLVAKLNLFTKLIRSFDLVPSFKDFHSRLPKLWKTSVADLG